MNPLLRPERVRFPARATGVTVLGLIVVPLVVGGLMTWALWQPTDRLDHITAAIVNQDTPVTVGGQTVPLGRQLAAALVTGADAGTTGGTVTPPATPAPTPSAPPTVAPDVSGTSSTTTFDWVLTDASDAAAGVASGRYGVVVTIPSTFSAAATSTGGDPAKAVSATLQVQTSPEGRPVDSAIAQTVAATATQVLGRQLTQTYLTHVYLGFTTLHGSLGTAADGATKLATGAAGLSGGAAQLVTGSTSLADGVDKVSSGADSLASGVRTVASGASGLADGLGQLASGTSSSASTAQAAVPQATAFGDGLDQLAAGVTAPGGLAAGATQLAAGATQLQAGLGQVLALMDTQAQACSGGDATACAGLVGLIEAQRGTTPAADGTPTLTASAAQLAAGAAQLHTGISVGTASQPSLTQSLSRLAAGGHELADGTSASASGLRMLADHLRQSAAGASSLASGARAAENGAAGLADGAAQAASGAQDLAGGATKLEDGATALGGGATDLASGLAEAAGKVPTYSDAEATSLAAVVAEPVLLQASGTDLLGATSVPFLLAVALWLGGLATFLVLTPAGHGALGSTRSSVQLALAAFAPAALIGAVQGLVLTAAMGLALDLTAGAWVSFALLAVLAGVAFAAVNQGLVALLGGVGRFVSVVVGVVALATAVISTVPPLLATVGSVLPTAAALGGLQAVVQTTAGVGGAAVQLVLWTGLGLALATLAIARKRVIEVGQLTRWARAA